MNRTRWHRLLAVLILLPFAVSGCKSASKDGRPRVLRYAYSPQSEQMESGNLRRDLMVKYLQNQLHMPVEVVAVEGYAPTIEAMRANKVDIAGFGALSYIIAAQKAHAQAVVAYGFPETGKIGGYRSAIAVPKGSPIHSIEDLKAHARDLVFAFSDPASTSGNLYPRVGLMNMGINPEKDFKKVLFAGSHRDTVLTLKAGKVDAGAFQSSTAAMLQRRQKLDPGDINILWTSDLIPNACIAVRQQLPDQLKKDIQAAFVNLPKNDPELWANMTAQRNTLTISDGGTQYVAVTDATYDQLRQYATQVKEFNFVEK